MNLETNYKIQKKGITLVIPNPCGNIKETKMKNSGIEWIGEIPDEWEVIKLFWIMIFINGYAFDGTSLSLENTIPVIRIGNIVDGKIDYSSCLLSEEKNELKNFSPQKGDIIIAMSGATTGKIGIATEKNAYINQRVGIIRSEINTLLKYYLQLSAFEKYIELLSAGSAQPNISMKQIQDFKIPLPPKSTQQRIATYLDKKCSKIEETIQNQQQVIEKLKAYKQSLITEAVTGKKYHENCHTDSILLTQNPNEDMKTEIPLGISYPCGNIEFKYCNLGFIADFKNGLNYNASDFGTEVKFLGVGDFQNYLVLNDESMFSNIITDTEIEDDYYLKNGDIIFVRSNGSKELVGRAIMVDNIDFKVTYSGFCIRLRNKEPKKINSKFLLYFFRSDYFRNELQRLSQGSNIANINQDLLSHIKIPLVDIRFQESVVDFLNKKCTAIDTAIEQKQNLIEKLTEYKKSLIYECVTGKKEV